MEDESEVFKREGMRGPSPYLLAGYQMREVAGGRGVVWAQFLYGQLLLSCVRGGAHTLGSCKWAWLVGLCSWLLS